MENCEAKVELYHHTIIPLVTRLPGSPWEQGQDVFLVRTDRDIYVPRREDRLFDSGTSLHLPRGLVLIRAPLWPSPDLVLIDPVPIIGMDQNVRLTFRLHNFGSAERIIFAQTDLFHLVFLKVTPTYGHMHYPIRCNKTLAFANLPSSDEPTSTMGNTAERDYALLTREQNQRRKEEEKPCILDMDNSLLPSPPSLCPPDESTLDAQPGSDPGTTSATEPDDDSTSDLGQSIDSLRSSLVSLSSIGDTCRSASRGLRRSGFRNQMMEALTTAATAMTDLLETTAQSRHDDHILRRAAQPPLQILATLPRHSDVCNNYSQAKPIGPSSQGWPSMPSPEDGRE